MSRYLIKVLEEYYREDDWYIAQDLNIYRTDNPHENPLAPDIAVFIGVTLASLGDEELTSWPLVDPDRRPPSVVFEVVSKSSLRKDLKEKPEDYGEVGVDEYIYYDPRRKGRRNRLRLRGWSYRHGERQEMIRDHRGWIWSEALQSWLAPDGKWLRLYDRNGKMRPTGEEAASIREQMERIAREAALLREHREREAKEAERAAKEAERQQKERAWAKLREMGIDPVTLEPLAGEHQGG